MMPKVGALAAAALIVVAVMVGRGSAAPSKPGVSSVTPPTAVPAATPAAAAGGSTLALKDGALYSECTVALANNQVPCGKVQHVVAVTFAEGFVIATQQNGARVILPSHRIYALWDVATVAEKP